MGRNGDKATIDGAKLVETLIPKLEVLGEVSTGGMFGGYGIFQAGKMFAIVTSGAKLFLKVDDSNRDGFPKAMSAQHGKMPYFQVPAEVISGHKQLIEWANWSVRVAHG